MRVLKIVGLTCLCFGLATAPASATVTPGSAGGSQAYLTSDDSADSMALSCVTNEVRYNALNLLACDVTADIFITGNGGNDTVDLSAIVAGDFPVLTRVLIDGGDGTDTVVGSQTADTITSDDDLDSISAQGGDDEVDGGATVLGGPGDDVLTSVSHDVDGGSGDDRIEAPGNGPISGGAGADTLALSYDGTAGGVQIRFTFKDDDIRLQAPTIPLDNHIEMSGIEHIEMSLYDGGNQMVSTSAFSGDANITGGDGADTITAGKGEDFLAGGDGIDKITGGRGFDYIRGGLGNDQINVRDGEVDRVLCGDGTDTVVADRNDLLVDCEKVQLPAPVTGKIAGPAKVAQGKTATYTFSSSVAGSTYQCRLDKGGWKTCSSPHKIKTAKLAKGKHTLYVRAAQPKNNPDTSPSKKTFKVT